jgi:hypothetical protein
MDQGQQFELAHRGQADVPANTSWLALGGIIATVSVFAIAQGLSYPMSCRAWRR